MSLNLNISKLDATYIKLHINSKDLEEALGFIKKFNIQKYHIVFTD